MPAVPTTAFARRLRSLDPAELRAFVVDLWTARGFETTVDGDVVVAKRASGSDTVRIACGPTTGIEPVDAVIDLTAGTAPEREPAVRTLGPEDLLGMLLYAVDRDVARSLHRRHFGRPLDAAPDPPVHTRLVPAQPRQVLVGGLVLLVAVSAVLGAIVGFQPLGGPEPSAPDRPVAPVAPVPDPPAESSLVAPGLAARTPLAMAGPARAGGLEPPSRYPSGLDENGVSDLDALVAGHRAALAETAWALEVRHEGSLDLLHPGTDWNVVQQAVVRTSPTRYRFEVNGLPTIGRRPTVDVTYVDFGDGTVNYRRTLKPRFNPFQRTRLPADGPPGLFARVSAAYVHRYLSTTRTRVEPARIDGRDRLLVIATGEPTELEHPVVNYTAAALVDRRGVVHSLVVTYTLRSRPAPSKLTVTTEPVDVEAVRVVRFRMSLSNLGTATVPTPGWYHEARNATNGTVVPPWPNEPAV